MAQKKDPYQNIFYATPFLYVNEDKKGKRGKVLLFIFVLSRSKDKASHLNIAQDYISITPNEDDFMKSDIVSFNDFDCPIWADDIGSIALRNSIFIVPQFLTDTFWDTDEVFIKRMIDKTSSMAFTTLFDFTFDSMNTVLLEEALQDYAMPDDGNIYFKMMKPFGTIKIQRISEVKN